MARGIAVLLLASLVGCTTGATVEPTPRPVQTAEPTATEVGLLPEAQAFVEEMGHTSTLLRVTLEQMAADAVGRDLFVYGGSTLQLQVLSEQAVRWLDEHPPHACYLDLHAATREVYAQFAAAGEQLTALADAGDPAAIDTADAVLAPATAAMDSVTPQVDGIAAACRP